MHETCREERAKVGRERQEAVKAGKPVPKRKGLFSYYFKAVSEDKSSPTKVTEQQVMDAILAAGFSPLDAMERQSQYSMPLQGLIAAMKKEDYPSFSPAFCGAEQGMIGVGPDGLIYPCWDLVAMEEQAVGFTDVKTGRFFFNFGKAKWRTRTADLMKPCQTCPYIFICRGRLRAGSKTGARQLFPRTLRRGKGDFCLCGAPDCWQEMGGNGRGRAFCFAWRVRFPGSLGRSGKR